MIDIEGDVVDVTHEMLGLALEEVVAVMYQMVDGRDDVFDALLGPEMDLS
jgi:hypothetical protein